MLELIGLLVAFVTIFVLRFRGFDFAASILIAATIIGITSGKPITIFVEALRLTITDLRTWELCAAVAFITILGYALKETGHMVELIDKLRSFLPSRFLLALIPALFGILAMPGGALMSAPFNEPEADRLKLRPEHRTFINVWFRHVWYWASPISPTTIIAVSLTGIALREFIAVNFLLFIVTWIPGSTPGSSSRTAPGRRGPRVAKRDVGEPAAHRPADGIAVRRRGGARREHLHRAARRRGGSGPAGGAGRGFGDHKMFKSAAALLQESGAVHLPAGAPVDDRIRSYAERLRTLNEVHEAPAARLRSGASGRHAEGSHDQRK